MWQAVRHEYTGDEEAMPTLIPILDKPWLAPNLQMAEFWTWFRTSKNIRPWPCILISPFQYDGLDRHVSSPVDSQPYLRFLLRATCFCCVSFL
jgi:hypothetical protein